jgi:hypothetical protein
MNHERDNSWGRGYYPLPPHLAGLGRFMDGLRPTSLLDHKVWPDDPAGGDIHMLTVGDRNMSVFARDLVSLLQLGLVRIQSNDPGEVSFYFLDKHETAPRRHYAPRGTR